MALAVLEGDASYFQHCAESEVQGKKISKAIDFFYHFMKFRFGSWAESHLSLLNDSSSLSSNFISRYSVLSVPFQVVEDVVSLFHLRKIQKRGTIEPPPISQSQYDDEVKFLQSLLELICNDFSGRNYLFDGLEEDRKKSIVHKLWEKILNDDTSLAIGLVEKRFTRVEGARHLGTRSFNRFVEASHYLIPKI